MFSEFRKHGNDRLSVNKNIWVVFEVDYGKTNSDLLLQCGPPAITKDDISDFCRSQYVVNVRARFCCLVWTNYRENALPYLVSA
jgi:hypothetical protein